MGAYQQLLDIYVKTHPMKYGSKIIKNLYKGRGFIHIFSPVEDINLVNQMDMACTVAKNLSLPKPYLSPNWKYTTRRKIYLICRSKTDSDQFDQLYASVVVERKLNVSGNY